MIGAARRRVRPRTAAPRRRPHPPRHALAGPGAAIARHHVRAGGVAALARPAARRSTRWSRTTSRSPTRRSRRPGCSRSRPRGRWTSSAPARVRADLGMVKAHVSKVVLAVLDRTIQVCGALGYSSDLPVEEWYRTTRFGPIGDGPDELHKSVLARTLLKGYTPVEGWPTEHIPSRRPAAEEKWQATPRTAWPVSVAAGRVLRLRRHAVRAIGPLRDVHLASCVSSAEAVGVDSVRRRAAGRLPPGHGGGLPGGGDAAVLPPPQLFGAAFAATGRRPRRDDRRGHRRRGRSTASTGPRSRTPCCAADCLDDAGDPAAASGSTSRSSRTSTTSRSRPLERLGLAPRDRRVDELGAGALVQAGRPHLPGRAGGRRVRAPPDRCCSWATAPSTTSSGRAALGMCDRVARRRRASRCRPRTVRPDFVIERLGQVVEIVGAGVGR